MLFRSDSIKQDQCVIEFQCLSSDERAIEKIQKFDRMRLKYKFYRVIQNHSDIFGYKGMYEGVLRAELTLDRVEDFPW